MESFVCLTVVLGDNLPISRLDLATCQCTKFGTDDKTRHGRQHWFSHHHICLTNNYYEWEHHSIQFNSIYSPLYVQRRTKMNVKDDDIQCRRVRFLWSSLILNVTLKLNALLARAECFLADLHSISRCNKGWAMTTYCKLSHIYCFLLIINFCCLLLMAYGGSLLGLVWVSLSLSLVPI